MICVGENKILMLSVYVLDIKLSYSHWIQMKRHYMTRTGRSVMFRHKKLCSYPCTSKRTHIHFHPIPKYCYRYLAVLCGLMHALQL